VKRKEFNGGRRMTNYRITEIEGIGPNYAKKLGDIGITNVGSLLKRGASQKGRKEIADATGLDHSLILKWVNMADLFRVRGIGSEYAELMEKAGVDTVKELRNRNADNLTAKLAEINSQGPRLVRALPGKKRVQEWIDDAKNLDPLITF
jgi:predicted flap endonuclease-1-like 5' DNA nuclease